MANFLGLEVPANIRYARWDQLSWASLGFGFASAPNGGTLPLREGFKFNAKTTGPKDFADRDMQNAVLVEFEGDLFDSRLVTVQDVYMLSKGPFHGRFKSQSQEHLNFVKNTATVAAPNATNNIGWAWKLNLDQDSRKLNVKGGCELFDTEWRKLITDFGTAYTGGASGTALGLTGMTYVRSNFVRSNFIDFKVDGFSVGIMDDCKLELESTGKKTMRKIPYMQNVQVKGEVMLAQSSSAELLASVDTANEDRTFEFMTAYDENFKFTTGALSGTFDFTNDDKNRGLKLTLAGTIPYNVDEGDPNAIFWQDTPGEAEFMLIGTGV